MFILNTQVDGCEYRDIYNLHSSGLKHPIYMQSTAQLHIFGWIYVLSCHDDRFIVSEQIVQNIESWRRWQNWNSSQNWREKSSRKMLTT